jgi:hypothetical protein
MVCQAIHGLLQLSLQTPRAEDLATGTMNRVFSNTAATYKFYWLLSLLDMYVSCSFSPQNG